MKYFIIIFFLLGLAWIGVDIFIPAGTCVAMSVDAWAAFSQCCAGFLLVGLVGSFIIPVKEFMGIPIALLRVIYIVGLLGILLLSNTGVPITPENLQQCDKIIGGY